MRGSGSIIGLIILVLDIIAIIDIVKSGMDTTKKLLWIIVILLFPIVGLILYYLFGKGKIKI